MAQPRDNSTAGYSEPHRHSFREGEVRGGRAGVEFRAHDEPLAGHKAPPGFIGTYMVEERLQHAGSAESGIAAACVSLLSWLDYRVEAISEKLTQRG